MFQQPINAGPGRIVTREISASSDEDEDDPINSGNTSPTYVYADLELLD